MHRAGHPATRIKRSRYCNALSIQCGQALTVSLIDRLTQPNCDAIDGLESMDMQENGAQERDRTSENLDINGLDAAF